MITAVVTFLLLQARQEPVLSREPKLGKAVEVRVAAEPVEVLVKRVADETGVELTVSPALKHDAIVVYAKAPAREVLEKVASHLHWTWVATDKGFRLEQTPKQQAEEKRNREEQILKPYLKWQQEAIEFLKQPADKEDRAKLMDLIAEHNEHLVVYEREWLQGTEEQKRAWAKKRQDLEERQLATARRLSPTWRIADAVTAEMTRADMLEMDGMGKLVFGYPGTAMQRRMGPKAVAAADAMVRYLFSRKGPPDRELAGVLNVPVDSYDRDRLARVTVAVQPVALAADDGRDAVVHRKLYLVGANGNITGVMHLAKFLPRPEPEPGPVPKHEPDRLDEKVEVTQALAEATVMGPTAWTEINRFINRETDDVPARRLARLLVEIASAAKVNFISDCYDLPGWTFLQALPAQTPRLAYATTARRLGSDWTFDGSWASLRSKSWQLRRASTLPQSVMVQLRDVSHAEQPDLDRLSSIVAASSDRQLCAATAEFVLSRSPWRLNAYRDKARTSVLRFWGSLPPMARANLLAGRTVRYGSLSREQQSQIRRFVLSMDHVNYSAEVDPRLDYGLEAEEIAALRSTWPSFGDSGHYQEIEPTIQLPNGIHADAQIGMRQSIGPALLLSNGNGWYGRMSESSAFMSGYVKYDAKYLYRPGKQQRFAFTVWCSPGVVKGMQFGVIGGKSDGDYVTFEKLPPAIRGRLDEAKKRRDADPPLPG